MEFAVWNFGLSYRLCGSRCPLLLSLKSNPKQPGGATAPRSCLD
jgi:hypothetical protein